jgi:beta-lactamase superfamily II metal-dependent hydrolase
MLTIEPGLTLKSLWPKQDNSYEDENANEGSLVLLLSYKNMNFLLTGD